MQIVATVMTRPSLRRSLREIVLDDLGRLEVNLAIASEKKMGRKRGWAKIKAADLRGVLNMSWQPESRTLVVRAVSKQGNTPSALLARFVTYLLDHRRKYIANISIRVL